ncbi:cupin domain-containing protein [Clostridium psychrophilum]|uniref:cupin domain-containing protein n=1 Tax=Clostridium psychrophilum TaxID=132926 RepID=UPI001C0BF87A|nr:cupin domain-containing protein [Clostridium psychrophilum]MBU3181048.1 cupin domain-containing protein [Clostridium psychrophilum]
MKKIEVIRSENIEEALSISNRQYLVGNLALPQELDNLPDNHVEVGITEYKKDTIEKPHYHKTTSEYVYVVEGECKYIDVNTKEETFVKKGDFFLIRKDITYAQKSKAGLKLLFFKYPSGNDKVKVGYGGTLEEWYKEY